VIFIVIVHSTEQSHYVVLVWFELIMCVFLLLVNLQLFVQILAALNHTERFSEQLLCEFCCLLEMGLCLQLPEFIQCCLIALTL